jgi:hypothetical protein
LQQVPLVVQLEWQQQGLVPLVLVFQQQVQVEALRELQLVPLGLA